MRNTGLAYVFWCLCLVGVCGIQRFYAGKWVTGIIWLLTGGLLLVGQIIDLLLIPRMIERANRTQVRDEAQLRAEFRPPAFV